MAHQSSLTDSTVRSGGISETQRIAADGGERWRCGLDPAESRSARTHQGLILLNPHAFKISQK